MDERDLLVALARAIGEGLVSVEFDHARLMHTDSPVAVQADQNRWLYGIAAAVAALGFGWDWRVGVGALVLGTGLYLAIGRPWVRRRMRARFFSATLYDSGAFKRLWRIGGVTLRAAGAAPCAAPAGDWRRFVLNQVMGARTGKGHGAGATT